MNGVMMGVASALLFGASTPASKVLLKDLTPLQLAGLLYLGAALGVLPLAVRERSRTKQRFDSTSRKRLAGAVLLGGAAAPILLLFGLRLSSASSVSLILNLEMAATATLGVLLFQEHLHWTGWFGVVGISAAAALLSGGGGLPGIVSGLLVAAACVCWGMDNHLTALIDGMTPAQSTAWKGTFAGTMNLVIGAVLGPIRAAWGVIVAALGVGALSYGLSIALYISSAQQLGATRAQGLFAAAPFMGAGLSFLLLGETFGPLEAAGAGLLIVSVAVLFAAQHSHEHRHDGLEHIHSHRHDDGHHLHEHPDSATWTQHSHWHWHEAVIHAHPHWPDLHHRHGH